MNTAGKIGLTAAALIACTSAASADEITQTLSFGPAEATWVKTFSFSPFITALGTLTEVSTTITETLTGTITVTNSGGVAATYMAFLDNSSTAGGGGLFALAVDKSNTVSDTLEPGDNSGALPVTGSANDTASTTTGLDNFEGGGPVDFTAVDNGALLLSSDEEEVTATFTDSGEITEMLTYTYTPATPAATVPEPGTLTLLGSALAGFAFFRRRKRA